MTGVIVAATGIGFAFSLALTYFLIPYLRKLKFGQQVRDDGPQSHLSKQGTPTMGGLAFIVAITLTGIVFGFAYPKVWPILLVTIAYGAIGFLDDYLKVVRRNTDGLKPKQKLLMQFIVMAFFCLYMMLVNDNGTTITIPFVGTTWKLSWFYPFFLLLVMLGTDNGVNFTDGVDGLCSSVTAVVAIFLTAASLVLKIEIFPITAAVFGAMLGFLCFNSYPAKLFMGDTGSLALGGFVASSFLILGQPILILLVGFVYFAEILSSIIQVTYFKRTGGKRIFKMAPIHHHFELCGWSETRIVTVFTIVTILLSLIAFIGL